jgi:hypothetical protein
MSFPEAAKVEIGQDNVELFLTETSHSDMNKGIICFILFRHTLLNLCDGQISMREKELDETIGGLALPLSCVPMYIAHTPIGVALRNLALFKSLLQFRRHLVSFLGDDPLLK